MALIGQTGIILDNPSIYNDNGTINSNRTVNLSSFTLNFSSSTAGANTMILSGSNVGIGIANPTTALHISAVTNPITIQGLSAVTGDASVLSIDSNGIIHTRTVASIVGSGAGPGSGTSNYLPKWNTDGTGLTSTSLVYDNGTNVGVGTASPAYKLDVSGTGRFSSTLYADTDILINNYFKIDTTSTAFPATYNGIWRQKENNHTTYFLEDEQAGEKDKWAFVRREGYGYTRSFTQSNASIININLGWETPNSTGFDGNTLLIDPVINVTGQTGTKVRGVYYNPTISAAVGTNHIAWENTSGTALFGSTGSGNVVIGTTGDSGNKLYVSGLTNPLRVVGMSAVTSNDANILTSDSNGVVHILTGATNRIPFFDASGKITTSTNFGYSQGGTANSTTGTLSLPSVTPAIDFGVGRVQIYSPGIPNGLVFEAAAGQGGLGTISQWPDTSKYFWFKNKTNNTYLFMGNYNQPNSKFLNGAYVQFAASYASFGGQVIVNASSAVGAPNPVRTFWGTAGAGFNVLGITYTEANSTVTPATRSDIVANSFQVPTFSASTTIITSTQTYSTVANNLMYYSASTAGVIQSVTINDSRLSSFYNASLFTLPNLGTSPVGTASYLNEIFSATSNGYISVSYAQAVGQTGATDPGFFTGVTTGSTIYYTGVTTGVTYSALSNVYIAGAPIKANNVSGDTYALKVFTGDTYLGAGLKLNNISSGATDSYVLTKDSSGNVHYKDILDISGTSSNYSFTTSTPSSYTLSLVDGNNTTIVEMTSSTVNTIIVPANSAVTFNIGTQISVVQAGTGQTSIVADSGVTILSAGGALKLRDQYSFATLIKKETNTWYLSGDITT
jgi:hypothetical protein